MMFQQTTDQQPIDPMQAPTGDWWAQQEQDPAFSGRVGITDPTDRINVGGTTTGQPAPTTSAAPTGNPMDPAWVQQQVLARAQQMQAAGQYVNPSVFSDPGYWAKRIIEKGGWQNTGPQSNNIDYFSMRFGQPEGAPEGSAPAAGGGQTLAGMGGNWQAGMDPSYDWRFRQGQQAIERSAAARGTLLTGDTAKALTDYGQGAASQEFGNIFNRNFSLAGLGLNAQEAAINGANGVASAGSSYGNTATQQGAAQAGSLADIGNANAAGSIANANLIGGALNNARQYNPYASIYSR